MIEYTDNNHTHNLLSEFKRRQEATINNYEPSHQDGHNQKSYHTSGARYRLLFGGNQSGKSHAAAYDCACNARGRNPYKSHTENTLTRDCEIWVISAEYSTIKTGIYRHIKNIIPSWDLLCEGPRVPGHKLPSFLEIRRADGYKTTITFMSAKGESREKFQAAAVDYFYIDEEIQEDIWEELEARTLSTGGYFSISATLVESYDWILALERQAQAGSPTVFLTRLNTELNPYLDSTTVTYLKEKWSQETLEYRFYGRSRRISGLIYNNWDSNRHIIKPFRIPYDWPRWCAIDPGIRTCAALWIAVGPDKQAIAYRELYAHNEPLWSVAAIIKQLEGYKLNEELTFKFGHNVWEEQDGCEYLVTRLIDPKGRARSEAGEASIISQLYSRYGISCIPADNSLRPGLEDCRYWLERGFTVFDFLVNFIEERSLYRARPTTSKRTANDPIEDPIRRKNHLMDCWRYIAREQPSWSHRDQMPLKLTNSFNPADIISKRRQESNEFTEEYIGSEY